MSATSTWTTDAPRRVTRTDDPHGTTLGTPTTAATRDADRGPDVDDA